MHNEPIVACWGENGQVNNFFIDLNLQFRKII